MISRILAAVAVLSYAFIEGWFGSALADSSACRQNIEQAHANFKVAEGWQWITTDDKVIIGHVNELILAHLPNYYKPELVKTVAIAANPGLNANIVEVGFFDEHGCFIAVVTAPAKAVQAVVGSDA